MTMDARLRGFLLAPCGRVFGAAAPLLLTGAAFAGMAAGGLVPGALASGGGGRIWMAAVLALPLLLMTGLASATSRRCGACRADALLLLAAVLAGFGLRLCFLPHVSADYENYLAGWMEQLRAGGFRSAMQRQIGEYNVLYQYLLFLAARLPVSGLLAVKAVSLAGDALLAGAIGRLAGRKQPQAMLALALLVPSIALNGSMFAQCDSLYAAAALWGLALALEGKPARAAACFALSLAFKLQALFLFPMLPVLWAAGKLRLRDIPVFLGTLLLVAAPALIAGKRPAAILAYYTGQTGLYTGLTYGAPTLFGLMNTEGLDVYAYGRFGVLLAAGACLLLARTGLARAERMEDDEHLRLAMLMAMVSVFLLPRMHERYFYLATALTAAMAGRSRRFVPVLALMELASVSRLWDMGISLRAASLMVMLAIVLAMMPERKVRRE